MVKKEVAKVNKNEKETSIDKGAKSPDKLAQSFYP